MSVRKRGVPPSGRFLLTPDDVASILVTVARAGVVSAPQLVRLRGGASSKTYRRLRKLHGLGVLAIHVLAPNLPNLITLTRRGAARVLEHGVPREDVHVVARVEHLDRHAEAVVDLRIGFMRACRSEDLELVTFLSGDRDLRRALGRAVRGAYIPDALVVLRNSGDELTLAYEIDRGHEPIATLAKKAEATRRLQRAGSALFGFRPWRPVLLLPDLRRLVAAAEAIDRVQGGELWAVGLLDTVHEPDGTRYALAGEIARTRDAAGALTKRLVPRG